MKKSIVFFAMLFIGMISISFAQKPAAKDYFTGNWEVLVKGLPDGDTKVFATLKRVDGKLTGDLARESDPNAQKLAITKIDETETAITIYFFIEGMDLDLYLKKQDENNMKGGLMNGSFESVAVRK